MGFLDLALRRRSVRRFTEPVPEDDLKKILEAGRWAPSGLNTQPWRFIVVDEPGLKKKLRGLYDRARERLRLYEQDSSFLEAGILVLACADASKPRFDWSTMLACENMLLAAVDLGYGGIVMTSPMDETGVEEFTEMFGIQESYSPIALLAFGVPWEEPDPKPRKDLNDTVSYNRF